jgi:hypothetical protein
MVHKELADAATIGAGHDGVQVLQDGTVRVEELIHVEEDCTQVCARQLHRAGGAIPQG